MYKQLAENIYCINVDMPKSPLGNLNAYVVKGKDRSLLVDTGEKKREAFASLSEGLDELWIDRDRLDIFLTHMHSDHIGLVSQLYRPGMRVFMGRTDIKVKRVVFDNRTEQSLYIVRARLGFPEAERYESVKRDMVQFPKDGFHDYTPVDEGDIFEYGGYRFTAIDTPGHTPGHVCLYEKEKKILFCGDHVLFVITPNITHWMDYPDALGDDAHSLIKVRDLDVELMLPGHRKVTGTLAQRVDEILEHHGARVKETVDLLDEHPGASSYELARYMHWNLKYKGDWENFPKNQKVFAAGEVRAHLQYMAQRGWARRELVDEVEIFYPIKLGHEKVAFDEGREKKS